MPPAALRSWGRALAGVFRGSDFEQQVRLGATSGGVFFKLGATTLFLISIEVTISIITIVFSTNFVIVFLYIKVYSINSVPYTSKFLPFN